MEKTLDFRNYSYDNDYSRNHGVWNIKEPYIPRKEPYIILLGNKLYIPWKKH